MIKKLFLIFSLLSLTIFPQQILILSSKEIYDKCEVELKAAVDFVNSIENTNCKLIMIEDLLQNENLLKDASVVWLHRPDTSKLNEVECNDEFLSILLEYVKNGGKLFLTLDGLKFLTKFGLENHEPQVQYVDAFDEGYGRKLGLHSFRQHPLFNDLFGGAYIWNPPQDEKVRLVGYFDDVIPDGKVIAIHWAYIRFFENFKLVLEHNLGKGKILSIGAYTYLSKENNNRLHLEKFLINSINYLTGKFEKDKSFYWEYDSLSTAVFLPELKKIEIPNATIWNKDATTISLTSKVASENFWDITGERIAVMGFEKSGIDEIWTHPFMAFRDYELGIKFDYRDTIYWFKDQEPRIEVRPECFIRTYQFPRAYVTEVITTDMQNPTAVAHYEYRGVYDAEIIVKIKSNLRLMWPYSENVLRKIKYCYDDENNLFIVKDKSEDFVSIFGATKKPNYINAGRYDDFNLVNMEFVGTSSNKLQIAFLAKYRIKQNDNFDFIFAGSSEGLEKTFEYYKQTIENTEKVFEKAKEHYKNLFSDKLVIETLDETFNEAYKWALVGTDRFFAYTPGIGNSLLAGYSTTRTGWDGGHKINGRPGYAWYFGRDAQWSGLAITDCGDFEKIREVLKTFQKYQDLSGKIYHELTTSGVVHYDASDATPLYIILAGHYLKHSGDIAFIKDSYKHIKKAIEFCFSTDTDGDKLIENTNVGHGWVEGGSLYNAHTEIYLAATWAYALEQAAFIARTINEFEDAKLFENQSKEIVRILNTEYWNDKTNFLNFAKLKDGTYNEEITVLPTIPLYFEQIEKEKAEKVIAQYAENSFSSDWGVRILSELSPNFNPRGYHFGSVWPLFTGWTSLAEYKYGNYVQGFSHLMNNLSIYKFFSLGFIEEVLNGAEFRPGGVCPHQCWSQTMALQPIYEGMLNLKIDAIQNSISISPSFPFDWNFINVKNIRIGNNRLNFLMGKNSERAVFNFTNSGEKEISLSFNPSFPLGTEIQSVKLNGKKISFEQIEEKQALRLKMKFNLKNTCELEINLIEGVGVLPIISNPIPYQQSEGLRILSTELNGNDYKIVFQGRPNEKYNFNFYAPFNGIFEVDGGKYLKRLSESVFQIEISFDNSENKYVNKIVKIKL